MQGKIYNIFFSLGDYVKNYIYFFKMESNKKSNKKATKKAYIYYYFFTLNYDSRGITIN